MTPPFVAPLSQYRRVYTTALSLVRQHLVQCLRAFDSAQSPPVSNAAPKGTRRPVVCCGLGGWGHCSELVLLRASLLQQIPWRQLKS